MPARFRPNMLEESEFLDITIVWGLKKRDLSACHASDVKCIGTNVWDDAFDLNLPPAQIALKVIHYIQHYGQNELQRVNGQMHIVKIVDINLPGGGGGGGGGCTRVQRGPHLRYVFRGRRGLFLRPLHVRDFVKEW